MKRILFFILTIFSFHAAAEIDISKTVHCTYQKGQALTDKESENIVNSVPLKWTFNALLTDNPMYVSGGDTGNVFAVTITQGVGVYLPDNSGTHSFTLFNSGKSFWNKQMGILNMISSQQYIGTCTN